MSEVTRLYPSCVEVIEDLREREQNMRNQVPVYNCTFKEKLNVCLTSILFTQAGTNIWIEYCICGFVMLYSACLSHRQNSCKFRRCINNEKDQSERNCIYFSISMTEKWKVKQIMIYFLSRRPSVNVFTPAKN